MAHEAVSHPGHGGGHGDAHGGSHGQAGGHGEGQQHPLKIYLNIWGLLFVLSFASYLVDYFHVEGYLRWFLIITFMMLKAGLIVAVFMHMVWERLAMVYAILVPVCLILTFIGIGAYEGRYTYDTRGTYFAPPLAPKGDAHHGGGGSHGTEPAGEHSESKPEAQH
jgi:cytochrome c oxidase subunit IV